VVHTSSVCHRRPIREDFGPIGIYKLDSCFFPDPYVVSGWVKDKLGAVTCESFEKWNCLYFLCILRPQAAGAARVEASCFALRSRALLKGVISRVALSVKLDQMKKNIPGVW
jgi:hypothetical protein